MAIAKAIFKFNNGKGALLCSKCHVIIKTGDQFTELENLAIKGTISLIAQYCDEHKYMEMFGMERKREMLRKGIQEQLREGLMRKNILNIAITRPDQKLVIMRGIPGSGKSTKAKSLVGEGIIHSTDDLIEAMGDYNGYFKRMIESKDWSKHGKTHKTNLLNAKKSMEEGISPVIIDNTNIKAFEPKKYIEVALKMGLDEANITIVDIGDGGCTVEVLAERNTHNVPLYKIKQMMDSHKGVGTLTVQSILEAKGSSKSASPRVLYSGVMLDEKSKSMLLAKLGQHIPEGWKTFAHHMTITFGKPLPNRDDIGKDVTLNVKEIGINDMVIAVKVEGYPTTNDIPHITIAVNVNAGGKPVMSNKITNWKSLDDYMSLTGKVQEVMA